MHVRRFQPDSPAHAQAPHRAARRRRAYSLLEVLITVLIIQMISGMVIVNVSSVQSTERIKHGGEQMIVALRYARILAMSTGQAAGVEFDVANNQFRVFQGAGASTVSNPLIAGGSYVIPLDTHAELSGVKISDGFIAGSPSTPFRVTFGTLGGTTNNGKIVLKYGSTTQLWLMIPTVGEATLQWPQ